jgi:V-type H+-transporting ATPase subunit a
VQFTDLNESLTPFQRRYVSMIRRCDELERKLAFFADEVRKCGLQMQTAGSVDEFLRDSAEAGAGGEAARSGLGLLEHLEPILEGHESHLRELNTFNSTLFEAYNRKVELQQVLNRTQDLMSSVLLGPLNSGRPSSASRGEDEFRDESSDSLLGDRLMDASIRFSSIAGVVAASERVKFERTLFRATRGNCFFEFMDMDTPLTDPSSGELVMKVAFVVFFKSATIETKIRRICDAFNARTYALPDLNDSTAIDALRARNGAEIKDSAVVLEKNVEQRQRMCVFLAQNVAEWRWTVSRERGIYATLNAFKADVAGMLRAEGWCVENRMHDVRSALNKSHENMGHGMVLEPMPRHTWPTPPTHFETNKFTAPFQDFVDTYGVPRYKEANPALFTAATFPFLFGVMYGDMGHGSILLLLGLYLCANERSMEGKQQGEMMEGLFAARYMLALMGLSAVYVGVCYNDFFALGLNLFGSRWNWPDGTDTEEGVEATNECAYGDASCVYPFGVDPAWHISSNELLFFNSMKMKLSVVLGICQMTLGICLKGMNAKFFHEDLDFWFEFVPMMVFNVCFFGYMVLLIFLKWSINWDARMYSATCNEDNHLWPACETTSYDAAALCPLNYGGSGDGCQPPNLITTLMNMALAPGSVDEPLYAGQAGVQVLLLLCAGVSVPILLVAKPVVLKMRRSSGKRRAPSFDEGSACMDYYEDVDERGGKRSLLEDSDKPPVDVHHHGEAHHDFSEVVIHQAIETIEFVLGMVSNTASYLRLWALSLAHSELATVFWEKVRVLNSFFAWVLHRSLESFFMRIDAFNQPPVCVLLLTSAPYLSLTFSSCACISYSGDAHDN